MNIIKGEMVHAVDRIHNEEVEGEVVEVRTDMLIVMDEHEIHKLPFEFNTFKKLEGYEFPLI